MKIFIINLPRSTDRREQVTKQMDLQGLEYELFEAVNGSDKDNGFYQKVSYFKRIWLAQGRPFTPGEIGCYASHYLLWKKCVELNQPIIILEDDILVDKNFSKAIPSIQSLIREFEFIRLEPSEKNHSFLAKSTSTYNLRYLSKNLKGTRGYTIAPSAAKQLYTNSTKWFFPVDNYIGYSYIHKVDSYELEPPIIFHNEELESTIQPKTHKSAPFYIKPTREIYLAYVKLRQYIYSYFQLKRYLNENKE